MLFHPLCSCEPDIRGSGRWRPSPPPERLTESQTYRRSRAALPCHGQTRPKDMEACASRPLYRRSDRTPRPLSRRTRKECFHQERSARCTPRGSPCCSEPVSSGSLRIALPEPPGADRCSLHEDRGKALRLRPDSRSREARRRLRKRNTTKDQTVSATPALRRSTWPGDSRVPPGRRESSLWAQGWE